MDQNLRRTIDLLRSSSRPSRVLDVTIAKAVGWRKQERGVAWITPSGTIVAKPPLYTFNLEHAYQLAQEIFPTHSIAISWKENVAFAQIGDEGNQVSAPTPAIALCLAALSEYGNNN